MYVNYLKSSHWKRTKNRFFQKKRYNCSLCWWNKDLVVHHKQYDNLNRETQKDLTYLCRPCHDRLHNDENLQLFNFKERWVILSNSVEFKKKRKVNKKLLKKYPKVKRKQS